jgi:hypothetical protein
MRENPLGGKVGHANQEVQARAVYLIAESTGWIIAPVLLTIESRIFQTAVNPGSQRVHQLRLHQGRAWYRLANAAGDRTHFAISLGSFQRPIQTFG